MAQAIAETIFDILYLGFALSSGFTMLLRGTTPLVKKLGWMAALLGAGDAFHLLPRSYALFTTGLEANAVALGIGKFVTSITMTIFYLILYAVWRDYFKIEGRSYLTVILYVLAVKSERKRYGKRHKSKCQKSRLFRFKRKNNNDNHPHNRKWHIPKNSISQWLSVCKPLILRKQTKTDSKSS